MAIDFPATPTAPGPGRPITCRTCGIVTTETWDGVPPPVLSALSSRKTIRAFAKGSIIFHDGDAVSALYRLLSGVVLLRKGNHDGNSIVTRMVVPTATFGFGAFIARECHSVTAQCATDVSLCCIPADVAELAFANNRSLERVFAQHVAHELDYAEDALLAQAGLSVHQRLLLLFEQFALRFGAATPDGTWQAEIPLLRGDMAALLGIARESFSRGLARIVGEGLLTFDGRTIRVPAIDRLRHEAEEIRSSLAP